MGWKYGYLENGRPFRKWIDEGDEKPHTLAGVTFTKREDISMAKTDTTPDQAIKILTGLGVPFLHAASAVHKAESASKAHLKEDDPDTVARNAKLAWIDGEAKRLVKLGAKSVDTAINEAMRNWAAQNNSPGQR
jgi:hypothetical protein